METQTEQFQIIKKAYQLCLDKIEEGYLMSESIVHAEDVNKAKAELLRLHRYDWLKLKYDIDEITYLNIPVTRAKDYDIVVFEGQEVQRYTIAEIKRKRERDESLNAILNNPAVQYCYIKKRGSYYMPNNCGYTDYRWLAGIYGKESAVSKAKSVGELIIIPIDVVEHNGMIVSQIASLESRLILTP